MLNNYSSVYVAFSMYISIFMKLFWCNFLTACSFNIKVIMFKSSLPSVLRDANDASQWTWVGNEEFCQCSVGWDLDELHVPLFDKTRKDL